MSKKFIEENSATIPIVESNEQSNQQHPTDNSVRSRWTDFVDSFKPATETEKDQELQLDEDSEKLTEIQRINLSSSKSKLQRKLKNRHLQMIAIASSIGSGLLIGIGAALATAGPGGVLIAWGLSGISILCTTQAMAELAVTFPVSGGFNVLFSRFIDSSVGFSVAWNYVLQYITLLPLELVAASITIQYWNTTVNPDVWVAIFYVAVISVNMFGVRLYGEVEFVLSSLKVIAVLGFIILSLVLAAGGAPNGVHHGVKFWHNPGAFANGFKGVAGAFITAAFSFAGTELTGLTSAEAENPRKALPKAVKQVFWRILLFYIVSITLITFLVPYNNPRLLGSSDVSASPFVISIQEAGISGLPSVMNAVILISVISVGSSSVYATSRTLVSLAEQNLAPKICGYVDRSGRPLVAIMITNAFGLISFIAASGKQSEVFTWLLSISGLSSIFTWLSICVAHLRFRRALSVQGRTTDELAFVSQTGIIGSWFGVILNVLVLIAEFWLAIFPLGDKPNAKGFFEAYLGFVILIVFYIGHKIWRKNWILFIRSKDIDIDSGRKETDLEALKRELEEEKLVLASKPWWYRLYSIWC
ncbi:GAP5 Amino-acid permease GAP5 [Candida maltosa Xu316]